MTSADKSTAVVNTAMNQFINQSKALTDDESAVDLIKQVVESPNIYSFSEFLDSPAIANLKNSNHERYHSLLKLFAYGTYHDYTANKAQLPELSETAVNKLRHLSIITLASKFKTMSYRLLLNELGITNVRELEDLIIEAFYAEIIKGKLDQQNAQLEIEYAIGRDVTDEEIDNILNILSDWKNNCNSVLKTIESEIHYANTYKQQQVDLQSSIESEVTNMKKSIKIQTQEVESLNIGLSKDGEKSAKKAAKSKK